MKAVHLPGKVHPAEKVQQTNHDHIPLIPGDWIYKLIERQSVLRVWLGAVLVYGIVFLSVGFTMAALYPNDKFTKIYDPAEIMNGANVMIFFWPMIWTLYRWFPSSTNAMIRNLEREKLIFAPAEDHPDSKKLSASLQRNFDQKWLYYLAVVGTVLTSLVFFLYAVPRQTVLAGEVNFWYYKPVPYILFASIFTFSNYFIYLMLFRQILSLRTIAKFFEDPKSIQKIYLLHPDRCGGFSGLGAFSVRMSFIVVLVFIWSLIYSYHPVLLGGAPLWSISVLAYIIYLLVVPVMLIIPLWFPHKAMQSYKNKCLSEISENLLATTKEVAQDILSKKDGLLTGDVVREKQLIDQYKILNENIPVWPIAVNTVRGFSITAIFPVVLSLIPTIVDIVKLIGNPG